MSKTRKDRAYDKGYEDGKEGGMLDYFVQKNKHLVPLPDHPDENSYDGGYEDGADDRYDKENSHYQGGNYESKSYSTNSYNAPNKQHRTYENKYKPNDGNTKGWEIQLIKLGLIIAVILGVIWLIAKAIWIAVAVILPLIIINVSTIAFICAFVKKKWQKPLIVLSFLGAIYIFLDYNFGGLTKILPGNVEAFGDTIPFFFYLNFSAGLVAGYFIIRDLLNKRNPPTEDQTEFSKRNIIIMACLLVIGGTTFFLQNYYGENAFANNTSSTYDLPAPPAKRYDYTGTVISVQEEGNKGFVYLDIKKADGTVQTFLMNGAKVYKNNSEVDSKQLVKGIAVGITGGDIAAKVDILSQ